MPLLLNETISGKMQDQPPLPMSHPPQTSGTDAEIEQGTKSSAHHLPIKATRLHQFRENFSPITPKYMSPIRHPREAPVFVFPHHLQSAGANFSSSPPHVGIGNLSHQPSLKSPVSHLVKPGVDPIPCLLQPNISPDLARKEPKLKLSATMGETEDLFHVTLPSHPAASSLYKYDCLFVHYSVGIAESWEFEFELHFIFSHI
ncbi:hypothetical protein DL93DRAFT_1784049 [Clavulina sp. PMI_390]|nr:hypothetical protein DL93DRAFT_1784049 [Clavulina sp. PMI_390]